ncbi:hypothetical protein AGLY_007779 [Aphis glycines]|uniref:Uncharacterized protein n=1 Tax=Aphis glycines TaxID=307491 RepID=A0A6G0TN59_APHGL|nr:hypothetical protein AGLY_007779 [Aphis glycines]
MGKNYERFYFYLRKITLKYLPHSNPLKSTKNAGSSRANCSFVSIRKFNVQQTELKNIKKVMSDKVYPVSRDTRYKKNRYLQLIMALDWHDSKFKYYINLTKHTSKFSIDHLSSSKKKKKDERRKIYNKIEGSFWHQEYLQQRDLSYQIQLPILRHFLQYNLNNHLWRGKLLRKDWPSILFPNVPFCSPCRPTFAHDDGLRVYGPYEYHETFTTA